MPKYDFKQAEEFGYALAVAALSGIAAALNGVDPAKLADLRADQLLWPFLAALVGRAVLGAIVSVAPRFLAPAVASSGVTEDEVRAILTELLATRTEIAAASDPVPPPLRADPPPNLRATARRSL